ncbi:MAG: hypothetical protein ACE5QV_01675, partial [Fidelibacterota bacterium]
MTFWRGPLREDEIRRLIKIVEESNIGELEVKRWGLKIRIRKGNLKSASEVKLNVQPVSEISD